MTNKKQTFLVTGSAGFIGFHISEQLLQVGHVVHGVDLMTASYYDPLLKDARLDALKKYDAYHHHCIDLSDTKAVENLLETIGHIDVVIHMAAQACVLRSFDFPHEYVNDNMVAFQNVLELYRNSDARLLVYASSSSVYGQSEEGSVAIETKQTNVPVSIYGATKIANEAMAQAYYTYTQKPIIGLRFFKVYGPWARPDTVFFKFADLMYHDEPIKLHNHGNIKHSYTYIGDITNCLLPLVTDPNTKEYSYETGTRHPVYNLGGKFALLEECVQALEQSMGKAAIRENVPLPHGDRWYTFADSSLAQKEISFKNDTTIAEGIQEFVKWYTEEYVPLMKDKPRYTA